MIKEKMEQLEQEIEEHRKNVRQIAEYNQKRVLDAFRNQKISDSHFSATTGYGYDDFGRDALESVYAEVFGGEDALVRPQLISGTHAITTALFGMLRPGDELMYITGAPYDTLEEVVGVRGENNGSLIEFGIHYQAIPLTKKGQVDWDLIRTRLNKQTKVIGIQRSKGYANRPSFTVNEIKEMIEKIKALKSGVIVFVDNCYGEFVEEFEPTHVGADLIAGSLIKNPGGGIVRTGGYIVGNQDLVQLAANRLTAPGLGKETGASIGMLQEMYQGLFFAPHIVSEALQGAIFSSRVLDYFGFQTAPAFDCKRTDLIQSVAFNTKEQMIAFCQSIQHASPINSHVTPYPASMPGYENDVIMAAGTFIQGASLELTADGPIRPPYTVFVQGGLIYSHVKLAITEAVELFIKKGYLTINENELV
ncbi:methionine gamma-lyase [Paraliobacillus sp. PM-2]|uniref:methionine gamma-lyase family protein n=1 Tax=Paraliobacillus sp. PM-2 TaxID=1462524 RepID=UPI00061C2571|nr:methionine gamma-lyase family protein [Paraliobacillus sp. PM-2]CQR47610.1 methionine gamma-lyase [Paraliobacillus sp. PM-2]